MHHRHHNRFMAVFLVPLRWASARRELLDFMVQGKIILLMQSLQSDAIYQLGTNKCSINASVHAGRSGQMRLLNIYGSAPKNSNTATFTWESHTGLFHHCGSPRHIFPPRGNPATLASIPSPHDSRGFCGIPSPCRSLVSVYNMFSGTLNPTHSLTSVCLWLAGEIMCDHYVVTDGLTNTRPLRIYCINGLLMGARQPA